MSVILAENLRRYMRTKGMSMAALSRAAGANPTAVYDILNGRTHSPKLDTVEKLAGALETTVLDLLSSGEREHAERALVIAWATLDDHDRQRLLETAQAWAAKPSK